MNQFTSIFFQIIKLLYFIIFSQINKNSIYIKKIIYKIIKYQIYYSFYIYKIYERKRERDKCSIFKICLKMKLYMKICYLIVFILYKLVLYIYIYI